MAIRYGKKMKSMRILILPLGLALLVMGAIELAAAPVCGQSAAIVEHPTSVAQIGVGPLAQFGSVMVGRMNNSQSTADAPPSSVQGKWQLFINATNRWSVLVLAIGLLIRALWRHRTESEFAGHPLAFKVYLGLLAALTVAILFGLGGTWIWVGCLVCIFIYGKFYTNDDMVENRTLFHMWLMIMVLCAIVGGGIACMIGLPGHWIAVGCLVTASYPLMYFLRHMERTLSQAIGGLEFDLIFSEGAFQEKTRPARHLPSVLLLQHWRDHGEVKRAWKTARKHLLAEERAFPVWMFAMETAVLHLGNPRSGCSLLKKLTKCRQFSITQQTLAISRMEIWMQSQGVTFESLQFKPREPRKLQSKDPLVRARKHAAMGAFTKAAHIYHRLLSEDPGNEVALSELVRMYAQDLKNHSAAEMVLTQSDDHCPALVKYLRATLDEWMHLEARSEAKRWYHFLPGKSGNVLASSPVKLKLETTDKPKLALPGRAAYESSANDAARPEEDPLNEHLRKLRQRREILPPPPPPKDKYDEMINTAQFGTAVDLLKKELETNPTQFNLWLRYAEVQGLHCGNIQRAERIIEQMDRTGHFDEQQMQLAVAKLSEWRVKHSPLYRGW